MRTLEVLEKVVKGKRIKDGSRGNYVWALGSLARYSEEWPESGAVINEWLVSLDGMSPTTVKLFYSLAKSAGRYMKKTYKIVNPVETAEVPVVDRGKKRRYLTVEEIVRVVKACVRDLDKIVVLSLIDSACRVGALANLETANVREDGFESREKTGIRRYRLDSGLCNDLRRLGEGKRFVFGGDNVERKWVVSSLKHRVKRIFVRAGFTGKKLGPHTLRHSVGSLVARETGSALTVKALLQQDDIESSMIYIHDADDVLQKRFSPLKVLVEKTGGFIGGGLKQLVMGEESVADDYIDVGVISPEDLMVEFPSIPENIGVRPLLKSDDLRLIRGVFLDSIKAGIAGNREGVMVSLLRRMLRKVK